MSTFHRFLVNICNYQIKLFCNAAVTNKLILTTFYVAINRKDNREYFVFIAGHAGAFFHAKLAAGNGKTKTLGNKKQRRMISITTLIKIQMKHLKTVRTEWLIITELLARLDSTRKPFQSQSLHILLTLANLIIFNRSLVSFMAI